MGIQNGNEMGIQNGNEEQCAKRAHCNHVWDRKIRNSCFSLKLRPHVKFMNFWSQRKVTQSIKNLSPTGVFEIQSTKEGESNNDDKIDDNVLATIEPMWYN